MTPLLHDIAHPDPATGAVHDLMRPPEQVMRLSRMGSFFPTRISFLRSLVRRMQRQQWRISRRRFRLDDDGYGDAVYVVDTGSRRYSLVAFSRALDPDKRTDRVIAEAWDTTFTLFDGVPGARDLARLARNVPRQEAGRFRASELVLSRANKSVRLFRSVVAALAAGRQPDVAELATIGYLMRTTAVYGNGKFGIADRACLAARPELSGPFAAEMLSVYLIREFTLDMVDHIARRRGGDAAVPLALPLRRFLGIGNSTGLGMAPFLNSHPILIDHWMQAREYALARTRAVDRATAEEAARFRAVATRASRHLAEWHTDDLRQAGRIRRLCADLRRLITLIDGDGLLESVQPWDRIYRLAEDHLGLEAQELAISLILEVNGPLIDGLEDCMAADRVMEIDPAMDTASLSDILVRHYDWALALDLTQSDALRQFWYVSADKQEPRLGDRYQEPGAEKEMPLDVAVQVQALRDVLRGGKDFRTVADLLLARPDLRHIVRRAQTVARHPYGEIRDSLVAGDCLAIDLLRCKLSFFGAGKFDPRSDRWIRITLFQGAPLRDELTTGHDDDWSFPVKPVAPAATATMDAGAGMVA